MHFLSSWAVGTLTISSVSPLIRAIPSLELGNGYHRMSHSLIKDLHKTASLDSPTSTTKQYSPFRVKKQLSLSFVDICWPRNLFKLCEDWLPTKSFSSIRRAI